MKNIFWTGFSNDERYSAIDIIKSLISKYADIVEVHLFSDFSLSMTIEIEEPEICKLYEQLAQIIGMQKFDNLNLISKKERIIYLNVTFAKGAGNLKIEVPNVPG